MDDNTATVLCVAMWWVVVCFIAFLVYRYNKIKSVCDYCSQSIRGKD